VTTSDSTIPGDSVRLVRLALALSSVAAVAAIAFIGSRSLWIDEALTAWVAGLDGATFADVVLDHSANLGLYYLLIKAWSAIGTSEAALRAFSALWAVATIPVFIALARRLAGRRAALIGGALLAVQPFLITMAQEARVYTLVAFLATAATLAFVRAVDEPSGVRWAAYTALAVLGVYAHAYAALILLAHAASLGLLPRDRIPWRHVLSSAAGGAVLLVPLAVASLGQAGDLVSWVPGLSARLLSENVNSFTQGQIPIPAWLRIAQLVLYAGAGVAGAAALVRGARAAHDADGLGRWRTALVLLWAGLPAGLVLLASVVKPLLVARYLIGSLPAIVLIAAVGLSRLRPAVGRAAVAALVASSVVILSYLYSGPSREDWRGATAYLASETGPGDQVYVPIEFGLPDLSLPLVGLEYYADRVDPPLRAELAGREQLMPELGRLAQGVPGTIWVATTKRTGQEVGAALMDALDEAGYEIAEVRRFGGLDGPITVIRFER